ncbi:MAG: hypothetical protein KF713_04100 [Turneriella sp.]|nr:hypothetical protein [Turneriella sp.]
MKTKILLISVIAFAVVACGSGSVRHPDKTTKIDLAGKSVLIVAEDNASGDSAASKAFAAAVAQKVGTVKIIPSIPGPAQGISKAYAEFGTKNGGAVDTSNPKALALDEILKLAASLGKFDTIVFVGAEKGSGMAVPKTIKMDLFGAVYDIPSKTVKAAVSDSATVVDTGVVAQMPLKAREITAALLDGIAP